jgi:hypothetical protein
MKRKAAQDARAATGEPPSAGVRAGSPSKQAVIIHEKCGVGQRQGAPASMAARRVLGR